jgi:hypothetical protein
VISTSVGEEDTVGTKDILGTNDVVGVSVIELLGAVDEDGGSLGAKDMLGDNVFVLWVGDVDGVAVVGAAVGAVVVGVSLGAPVRMTGLLVGNSVGTSVVI